MELFQPNALRVRDIELTHHAPSIVRLSMNLADGGVGSIFDARSECLES